MTITLTACDHSPEVAAFFAKVKAAQGHVTGMAYRFSKSKSIVELTAHVPEQPELLPNEHNHPDKI